MAQEYKVAKVSPTTKEWESKYGKFITYYVLLEGEGQEPVEMNKKPDSPAPKVGDTLYGTLTASQFGQKFKTEKRPEPSKPAWQPKDDKEIRAQAMLKSAVEYGGQIGWILDPNEQNNQLEALDALTKHLYALVDTLKGTTAAEIMQAKEEPVMDDKPVTMDSIPF